MPKIKVLSIAGKKGARIKAEKREATRQELFVELSKYADKQLMDYIQFSKVRWSNNQIANLINHYKNS